MILSMQNWLVFLREVDQIALDYAPTAAALEQRVKPEVDSQSKWRVAVWRYEDGVPLSWVRKNAARNEQYCLSLPVLG